MVKKIFLILLLFALELNSIYAQKVKFSLKYNELNDQYEVYGQADFSNDNFFVGGGSQLSVILPTNIIDYPLTINSVAGGPWSDNSQVYSPTIDAAHDYHGIATNGSPMSFKEGEEQLIFTFQVPKLADKKSIRLFDNKTDPRSNEEGMGGADFCNFYACALTLKNVYSDVYPEEAIKNEEEPELITSIESELAMQFDLYQNQPNPFKEFTSIGYYLPSSSSVTLTISDELGKTLRIIKEEQKEGHHAFRVSEKELSIGLLYYQLETKFGIKNKKMIHIK